jgi:hypothetical protein
MSTLEERIAARNKILADTSLVGKKKVTKKKATRKTISPEQAAKDQRIRERVAKFRAQDKADGNNTYINRRNQDNPKGES